MQAASFFAQTGDTSLQTSLVNFLCLTASVYNAQITLPPAASPTQQSPNSYSRPSCIRPVVKLPSGMVTCRILLLIKQPSSRRHPKQRGRSSYASTPPLRPPPQPPQPSGCPLNKILHLVQLPSTRHSNLCTISLMLKHCLSQ